MNLPGVVSSGEPVLTRIAVPQYPKSPLLSRFLSSEVSSLPIVLIPRLATIMGTQLAIKLKRSLNGLVNGIVARLLGETH